MSKRTIHGRRAIVTGASSGIGHAIARELARQGADLVVTARREAKLAALAAEITALGRRVEVVAGDLADPETRRRVFAAVHSAFGGLDILVNNAGVGAVGPFRGRQP